MLNADGECVNGIVRLEWSTQTEINNDYFRIERSIDGIDFDVVGTVSGAGNSSLVHEYTFTDENNEGENSYYRIVQVDYNGAENLIKTMIITCGDISELEISELYPNPTNGNITLNIVSPNRDEVTLSIFDASGKLVHQDGLSIIEGFNSMILPVQQFAPGVYLVKVINAYGNQSIKRFVKQ